jgi:hypothetical protein
MRTHLSLPRVTLTTRGADLSYSPESDNNKPEPKNHVNCTTVSQISQI